MSVRVLHAHLGLHVSPGPDADRCLANPSLAPLRQEDVKCGIRRSPPESFYRYVAEPMPSAPQGLPSLSEV